MIRKYSKLDFDANDKYPFANLGNEVINSIKQQKKSRIESFVLLHGYLELQLYALWSIYLIHKLDDKFVPLEAFLDYTATAEVLHQVGVIDKKLRDELRAFKTGRNTVAHLITNKFKKQSKKISNKALSDQFKKGVSAYTKLITIRKKLVVDIQSITTKTKSLRIKVLGNPPTAVSIYLDGVLRYTSATCIAQPNSITEFSEVIKEERKGKNITKLFSESMFKK